MKELSIADLIELIRHCNNMLIGTPYINSEDIDRLFAIQDACNKALAERMDNIYKSLPNNTSTT